MTIANPKPILRTKTRSARLPLIVMFLGAAIIVGHGFVEDYVQATVSPGGLYIADAIYNVPLGVKEGKYSHTFRIYNARPRWTHVTLQPDCGCTSVSWKESDIPPLQWKSFAVDVPISGRKSSRSFNIAILTDRKEHSVLIASVNKDSSG